jgi:hypothetical protein
MDANGSSCRQGVAFRSWVYAFPRVKNEMDGGLAPAARADRYRSC